MQTRGCRRVVEPPANKQIARLPKRIRKKKEKKRKKGKKRLDTQHTQRARGIAFKSRCTTGGRKQCYDGDTRVNDDVDKTKLAAHQIEHAARGIGQHQPVVDRRAERDAGGSIGGLTSVDAATIFSAAAAACRTCCDETACLSKKKKKREEKERPIGRKCSSGVADSWRRRRR